jgi:hypothetical protein
LQLNLGVEQGEELGDVVTLIGELDPSAYSGEVLSRHLRCSIAQIVGTNATAEFARRRLGDGAASEL